MAVLELIKDAADGSNMRLSLLAPERMASRDPMGFGVGGALTEGVAVSGRALTRSSALDLNVEAS